MKFLMIACDSGLQQDVLDVLAAVKVPGYTMFTDVRGSGETGRREGSPIWPGLNALLLIALPEETIPLLLEHLAKLRIGYLGQPRALKVFSFPVEELI